MEPGVHAVPEFIDEDVARAKLAALDISIDTLTPGQDAYLRSWTEGT
jgi:adenosylhomocysteinase